MRFFYRQKRSAASARDNHPLPKKRRPEQNESPCTCCHQLFCGRPSKNHLHSISAPPPPDINLETILANNKLWVAEMMSKDPLFFERTGGTQKPQYLYIGCADSRVPANQIMGLGPGEVFVHRNVGNLVPATDLNALTSIEYAVIHLDVKDIIVTGHYDCGAVRAALDHHDMGTIENWLRCIRDVYRLHGETLDEIVDDEERLRRLVELNVIETCLNVYKTRAVQHRRMETMRDTGHAYPRIHALVFDPKIGILNKIPLNFARRLGQMRHIYDLYDVQE